MWNEIARVTERLSRRGRILKRKNLILLLFNRTLNFFSKKKKNNYYVNYAEF